MIRLGRIHLMLFASQPYIDTFGAPANVADLVKHRLVMQVADQAAAQQTFESWFPSNSLDQSLGHSVEDLLVMKTNVSSAHYWAIANGAGIGALPTYACTFGGKIIPLAIEWHRPLDIWLSYHSNSGHIPRMRSMIDWLTEAFNPTRFPWFKDEFLHPDEFKSVYCI